MIYSVAGIARQLRKSKPNCVCDSYLINDQAHIYYNTRQLLTSNSDSYDDDFRNLELDAGADQESVRKSFLALCKKYHPDSGHSEANREKFQMVEKSYRRLLKKFSNDRWNTNDDAGEYGLYYDEKKQEKAKEYDILHTAPQHRQYLSFDGIGSGTPSQRQHQYTRYRASQAAENVREHRVAKLEQTGDALTAKDLRRIKNIKTRYGMDRLVEDMIQESMARGEFENLSGAGKPLKPASFNPYVDFITHKMNEVMIENGFTPEWITLGRDIEGEKSEIINKLAAESRYRNDRKRWDATLDELRKATTALNKKIQFFNLIVPILRRQMLLFDFETHLKKVLDTVEPLEINYSLEPKRKSEGGDSLLNAVFDVCHKLLK